MIEDLNEDPGVKPQIRALGGWEEVKKFIRFESRRHFPPIRNLDIADNMLYIQTYRENMGKEEYIIMNLSGKIKKSVFIPQKVKVPLMQRMIGVKLYSIYQQKLYYIKENPDEEIWELHMENIL